MAVQNTVHTFKEGCHWISMRFSLGYFLAKEEEGGRLRVVERDPLSHKSNQAFHRRSTQHQLHTGEKHSNIDSEQRNPTGFHSLV